MTAAPSRTVSGPTPRQISQAVAALRQGHLIIMPTETVYGVAAMVSQPAAFQKLRDLPRPDGMPRPVGQPFSWHAPSREPVLQAMSVSSPLHRRILEQLAPGPVRFLFPKSPDEAAQVSQRLGIPPGSIDAGGEFGVRVPDAPVAREVLEQAGGIVVAERASAFGLGDGRNLPEDIVPRAKELGIVSILDDGPTRLGAPASTVRLNTDGSYDVVSEGTFEARYISKKIERHVLFVCTGNTCRSPMAEAIARAAAKAALLQTEGPSGKSLVPTVFASAGTSTRDGVPITDEARRAMTEMGIDASRQRSQELTLDLIDRADAIYAMTAEHQATLLEIAPSAAGKIQLLDPAGRDIPDPIGGPLEDYRRTAARLKMLIALRLEELDGVVPGSRSSRA